MKCAQKAKNILDKKLQDRDYSISAIRLIAMLLIIACHILQGLQNNWAFWINVGVQIFLFISGFLYGKKEITDVGDFYKQRIKKILVPYMIVFVIILLLDIFLLGENYSFKKILGCFLGLGAFTEGGNILNLSHTWFVSYILLCYMLLPILQGIFNSRKFSKNFCLFIIVILLVQAFQTYGVANVEASWINNFIFGYFYSRCCKEKKQEWAYCAFMAVLFVIMMPIAIIYQEHLPVTLPGILNSNANIIVNYGHVMLGVVIFVALYKIFHRCKVKNNKLLAFSDKYSYYIYLVHQIFILYSFSVLFLTESLFVNILLILILSAASAIVVKKINDLLFIWARRLLKH